jgi:hypothetical protein
MVKRLGSTFVLVVLLVSAMSCATLRGPSKGDYGILESAVTFSADKVYGEYGDTIPDDFDGTKFMQFVKDRIPEDYFEKMHDCRIDVEPKKTYYLLRAYQGEKLILFDYSCTPETDGPILLEPDKYDLGHIESYDKCKRQ